MIRSGWLQAARSLRATSIAGPMPSRQLAPMAEAPRSIRRRADSSIGSGQAKRLAARPDVAGAPTAEGRIARLYRLLYGRMPSDEEVSLGVRFVGAPPAPGSKLTPWEEYAQILLLANEFAFLD